MKLGREPDPQRRPQGDRRRLHDRRRPDERQDRRHVRELGTLTSQAPPIDDLAWVVSRWYARSLGTFISEESLLGTPADPRCPYFYPLTIRRWGWMISGDSGNRRD